MHKTTKPTKPRRTSKAPAALVPRVTIECPRSEGPMLSLDDVLRAVSHSYLSQALERTNGDRAAAAELVAIPLEHFDALCPAEVGQVGE
jgi:DNA-binding NtrC family response regulator